MGIVADTNTIHRALLAHDLMTPDEVGEVFRVDAKTVNAWSRKGLLTRVPTPTGRIRYRRVEVERLSGWEERSA
jgi:predicted site-specific integrase-resolvase